MSQTPITPEQKKDRGRNAAWLLDQDIFREVMDACLVHAQMSLVSTGPAQQDQREQFYHQYRAILAIEDMLRNFVEDGKRTE